MSADIRTKLRRRCGETLTEVLLAILIVGISIAIMGGMISASAKLNAKAHKDESELYSALSSAESAADVIESDAGITVTVTPEGGSAASVSFDDVELCGVQDKLYAYYWDKGD